MALPTTDYRGLIWGGLMGCAITDANPLGLVRRALSTLLPSYDAMLSRPDGLAYLATTLMAVALVYCINRRR